MLHAEPRLLIPTPLDPGVFSAHMPQGRVAAIGGSTMGTRWSAQLVVRTDAEVPPVQAAMERALAGVIAEMSTWEPASLISRFNRAEPGAWFALPPMMFAVLARALAVAKASDGAFDPTIGALVDAWGFGPVPTTRLPSDAAIAAARARSGWQRIEIDPDAARARQPGGVQLDFSGIAKGFAVDRLSAVAREAGIANALVEIGGELRGTGVKPDGQPWWVEIETPPGTEIDPLRIACSGLCVATSGDYRRFHELKEQRLGHSIDPRTGRPVANRIASVSVIAADCMTADALATALTILGPDRGGAYAQAHDIAAILVAVDPDGRAREILSPRAQAMLVA